MQANITKTIMISNQLHRVATDWTTLDDVSGQPTGEVIAHNRGLFSSYERTQASKKC